MSSSDCLLGLCVRRAATRGARARRRARHAQRAGTGWRATGLINALVGGSVAYVVAVCMLSPLPVVAARVFYASRASREGDAGNPPKEDCPRSVRAARLPAVRPEPLAVRVAEVRREESRPAPPHSLRDTSVPEGDRAQAGHRCPQRSQVESPLLAPKTTDWTASV